MKEISKIQNKFCLFDVINSFITFWLVNLPKKQWKIFVRSRDKGATGGRAVMQCGTSNIANEDHGEVENKHSGRATSEATAVSPLRIQTAEGVDAILSFMFCRCNVTLKSGDFVCVMDVLCSY